MREGVIESFSSKSWKGAKPYIQRDFHDEFEGIVEKCEVYGYKSLRLDQSDAARFIVDAIVKSIGAKNDRDLQEVEELISDIYIYRKVAQPEFESWAKSDFGHLFPMIFNRVKGGEEYWILRDDPNTKEAFYISLDNTALFLSWCRED